MTTIIWADRPIWAPGISEDFGPYAKGRWARQSYLYYSTGGETGRKPPPYMEEYFKRRGIRHSEAFANRTGSAATIPSGRLAA